MVDNLDTLDINPDTGLRSDKVQNPNIAENPSNNTIAQPTKSSIDRYFENQANNSLTVKDSNYFQNIPVSAVAQGDLKNYLGANQSAWDQAANAIGRSLTEITLGTVSAFGHLGVGYLADNSGLTDYLADSFGKTLNREGSYVSGFSQLFNELHEDIDSNMNIYRRTDQTDFSGWFFENVPSIASAVTLMIPSMAVVKGLSYTGKIANTIGKTAGRALQAERILAKDTAIKNLTSRVMDVMSTSQAKTTMTGISQAVISRYAENLMEAEGVYSEMYEELLNTTNPITGELFTQDEAKVQATKAANEVVNRNWIMLAQDIPQYLAIGKIWNPITKGFVKNGFTKGALSGVMPKRLATFAEKNTGVFNLLSTMVGEGAEEAYQFYSGETSKYNVKASLGLVDKQTFVERMGDYVTDQEFWTSAFFGALGGGVFNAVGTASWKLTNSDRIKAIKDATEQALREYPEVFAKHSVNIQNAQQSGNPEMIKRAVLDLNKSLTQHGLMLGFSNNNGFESHIKKLEEIANMDTEAFNAMLSEFVGPEQAQTMSPELFKTYLPDMIEQSKAIRESVFKEYSELEKFQKNNESPDFNLYAIATDLAFTKVAIDENTKLSEQYKEEALEALNTIRSGYNNAIPSVVQEKVELSIEQDALVIQRKQLEQNALIAKIMQDENLVNQITKQIDKIETRSEAVAKKLEELKVREMEFRNESQENDDIVDDANKLYFTSVAQSNISELKAKEQYYNELAKSYQAEYDKNKKSDSIKASAVEMFKNRTANAYSDLSNDQLDYLEKQIDDYIQKYDLSDKQTNEIRELFNDRKGKLDNVIDSKLKKIAAKDQDKLTDAEKTLIQENQDKYDLLITKQQANSLPNEANPATSQGVDLDPSDDGLMPPVEGSPTAELFGYTPETTVEQTKPVTNKTVKKTETTKSSNIEAKRADIEKNKKFLKTSKKFNNINILDKAFVLSKINLSKALEFFNKYKLSDLDKSGISVDEILDNINKGFQNLKNLQLELISLQQTPELLNEKNKDEFYDSYESEFGPILEYIEEVYVEVLNSKYDAELKALEESEGNIIEDTFTTDDAIPVSAIFGDTVETTAEPAKEEPKVFGPNASAALAIPSQKVLAQSESISPEIQMFIDFASSPKNIEDYTVEFVPGTFNYQTKQHEASTSIYTEADLESSNGEKISIKVLIKDAAGNVVATTYLYNLKNKNSKDPSSEQDKKLLFKQILVNNNRTGVIKKQVTIANVKIKNEKNEVIKTIRKTMLHRKTDETGKPIIEENNILETFGNNVTIAVTNQKGEYIPIFNTDKIKINSVNNAESEGSFFAFIKGLDGNTIPVKLNTRILNDQEIDFLVDLYNEMFANKQLGNKLAETEILNEKLEEKAKALGYPLKTFTFGQLENFFVYSGKKTLTSTKKTPRGIYFEAQGGLKINNPDGSVKTLTNLQDANLEALRTFLQQKRRNVVASLFKENASYRNKILSDVLNTDVSPNPKNNGQPFFLVTDSYAVDNGLGSIFVTVKSDNTPINMPEVNTNLNGEPQATTTVSVKQNVLSKLKATVAKQTVNNIEETTKDTQCDF